MDPYLANDKYQAQLRSTWIASPADEEILVTAIPVNVPTIIAVGWKTQYETIFSVTGVSGDNSSNYALTGVTRLKGANVNLPEGLAVNCLNNEEYFNQYATLIEAVQETADEAQETIDDLQASIDTSGATIEVVKPLHFGKFMSEKVVTLSDGATPALDASLGNIFQLTAAGNRTIAVPSNPTNGQKIVIFHTASGGARTLALNSGATGFLFGTDVTALTETTSGKTDVIGAIYQSTIAKWLVVAYVKGY